MNNRLNALQNLIERYKARLPEKTNELTSIAQSILDKKGTLSLASIDSLLNHVHQMSGSAGTYGFYNISNICMELENKLIDQSFLNLNDDERNQFLNNWIKKVQNEVSKLNPINSIPEAA